MKIIFLAPEPFYEDRGSPIAINLVLRELSRRGAHVDVVTYNEGTDVGYEGVHLHRIPGTPFTRNIRPGFSWKKVVCDLLMMWQVFRLVSTRRYDLVYAVEESAFIALLLKVVYGTPYVYDMDSSLPQQIAEKYPAMRRLSFLLEAFERAVVRQAKVVVPVCDALAEAIKVHRPARVVVLRDVSLLSDGRKEADLKLLHLRTESEAAGALLMYVGNLEPYQGIDLLLSSFALAAGRAPNASLALVGGKAADIEKYRAMAERLGVASRVHFLGPQPVEHLSAYLSRADILVSPRIKGNNTPMKIYSYLDSGKALLATNLPTHTQVVDDRTALLCEPSAPALAEGMLRLIGDAGLRSKLGAAGKKLIEEKYSYTAFRDVFGRLYGWLEGEVCSRHAQHTRTQARSGAVWPAARMMALINRSR